MVNAVNLREELEKVPEFNDEIQYHWRNNEKTRKMELTYFIGYKVGGEVGTFKFETNTMQHLWEDSFVVATVEDYKNHLRTVERRARVEP